MNKKVHIISGGTVSHISTHLAFLVENEEVNLPDFCTPTWGETGHVLKELCETYSDKLDVVLHETRLVDPSSSLKTNEDIEVLLDKLIADPTTKIIFMPVGLCDFDAYVEYLDDAGFVCQVQEPAKDAPRLQSNGNQRLHLVPKKKLISKIRKTRKDIFLVGFKTTRNFTENKQYIAGLNLLKSNSCNLVLANDVGSRINMIVTPEEARYHVETDRMSVMKNLVEMAYERSHLTFTRSTVVDGQPVPWDSQLVPQALRTVVDYCIAKDAYKPFQGATVGHFACKLTDTEFLTSRRKTNFNELSKIGLVKVVTDGPDSVYAYGAKPSVGGQSQRIVFSEHPDYDCIVHAHVPIREGSQVPVVSQRLIECGSMACGKNTSGGLKRFGNLEAVYLEQHGPNIVFHNSIDPQEVIDFIEANFDLSKKTGGYVSEPEMESAQ